MKFDVSPPVIPASDNSEKRIICVSWAPDGQRLAVASADRFVTLVKSGSLEMSRFPIKAKDENSNRAFSITGLSWAPDSCRFAVAQSDMAVAVYDVGHSNDADARKKITLRFSHKSPVLCVAWPSASSNDFVYGMGDGAVMCGLTKMKKSEELYKHGCAPVSIAQAPRANAVVVGHLDGNVFIVNLDNRSRLIAMQTTVPPLALAWGSHICAAGADLQINFADSNGGSPFHVDFSNQTDLRSFTAAAYDPSGQTAIVAAKNSLITFQYTSRLQAWQQQSQLVFDGVYSIPCVAWSPDGSKIAVASVTGGLYIVTASIGSFKYKNLFEVVYVTGSQLKIVNLQNKKELFLKSDYRILTTTFQQDRYAVVRTTQSFVIGDTVSRKSGELPASPADGEPKISEKFIFFDDLAVLVWNSGELTVVEFGKSQPLASLSTQYANSFLLSLRFNVKIGSRGSSKILAYLVDAKTIRIVDLDTLITLGSVQIPNKIDWLELNVSGSMLLFRDSKRLLYVYNVANQSLNSLLSACSYAQWAPDANVIVAQSKRQLYVWYSPSSPDEVKSFDIEGEVVDIKRKGTKTAVVINSNGKNSNFPLDGAFIAFSAKMETNNLNEAAKILLSLENQENFKSLWGELAHAAMNAHDYTIAEVSYSNLNDLSKSRFLHKLNKLIKKNGVNNSQVQAQIAMLQSNFKQAEYCFIEHDQIDNAIEMYKSMHMWNELLDLADLRCPNKAPQLHEEYYSYLLKTGQYQVAANLKAKKGEISEAIDLCLQAEKPQLAADLLLHGTSNPNPQMLSVVGEALLKYGKYGLAGQVLERLGKSTEALEAYRKANSYYRALELAKAASPDKVIQIEREWADYLVSQGQNDAAIMHYVESGDYSLALNCALRAQQWHQAAEILRNVSSTPNLRDDLKLQYLRVGRHFASENDIETAEDLFLCVDAVKELVEMYLNLGRVDDAVRRAKRQMKQAEMEHLFLETAKKLEKKQQTRQYAEKIYVALNRPELASDMYNAYGDSNAAMRISTQYGGDKNQLSTMAEQAERDGNLDIAEKGYIQAGQWERALFMYQQEKRWKDAMRIAKNYGDSKAEVKCAAYWALSIGGAAGVLKLQHLKLVEQVLFYCCENGLGDLAQLIFQNCKTLSKNALKEGHMKFAIFMETQNKFSEAEEHYLQAEQPREAVEMYVHNKMWSDAQRLATRYNITDIPIQPTSSNKQTVSRNVGGYGNGLNAAIQAEQNGQYDNAIDMYLALTATDCGGEDQLDQVLERAVKLCLTYRQTRLQDVVNQVAQVLLESKRHASLGKILENIEAFPDAFEIYKAGGMWEDAARLSGYLEPEEQREFQAEYQRYLQQQGKTGDLMGLGQVDAALAVYAQNGEWDTCLNLAQKEGDQYLEKYTMMYAQTLVNQQKYDEAVSILAKYQPSSSSTNIPAYIALCQSTVYAVPTYDVIQPSFFALRQMLFKILRNSQNTAPGFLQLQNFTRAVHLLCQQASCTKYGLHDQALRASIALVRYCNVIPADFVFYKAGDILEKSGVEDQAIVFYNTFVDVYDVITSGDISNSGNIDHQAFEATDVPREMCLRQKSSVSDDVASSVRQWVLEKTMSGIDAVLPAAPCKHCGQQIYEPSLRCPYCGTQFDFCSITGYPVINPTQCTACKCVANRFDWGMYISKTGRCPCCDSPQTAGA